MKIRLVGMTLCNFKAFAGEHKFKLAREPGLYFVSGKNLGRPELGANAVGKSSLWDALFWCLYGKTIRDGRPSKNVVTWGERPSGTYVTVRFSIDGKKQSLTRLVSPVQLIHEVDGERRDIHPDEVTKVIGWSETLFRRTVLYGQFGDQFLDMAAEQQSRLFSTTLDLDMWLTASQKATKHAQEHKRVAESARESVVSDSRALEELTQLRDELVASETKERAQDAGRLSDLETTYVALVKQVKAARYECEKVGKLVQSNVVKMQNLEEVRIEVGELKSTVRELESKKVDNQEYVADRKRRFTMTDRGPICVECGQSIGKAEHKEQRQKAKSELERAETILKVTDVELSDAKTRLYEASNKLQRMSAAVEDAVAEMEQSVKVKDVYDALVAKLDKVDREMETLKQKRYNFEQVNSLDKKLEVVQASYERSVAKEAVASKVVLAAEQWAAGFKEIRLAEINTVINALAAASTRYAGELGLSDWRIKFATHRETLQGSTSLGFTAEVLPKGAEVPVKWQNYSGGESQRLQLACAFGLSEVLLNGSGLDCNLEIYDEPTRGLSYDGVSALLACLRERALTLGKTIYFVDHHSVDSGFFDGIVSVCWDGEAWVEASVN